MTNDVRNKRMVVGFLFDEDGKVALVEKTHPDWQRGLLNGIGGVMELGETPPDAMRREFVEETGVTGISWKHFATEIEPFGAYVYFYTAHGSANLPEKNDAGELLRWVDPVDIYSHMREERALGNLHWLLPLAQDPRPLQEPVVVHVRGDIRETPTW
jgi:8-oxo-dGTP diphosphatase